LSRALLAVPVLLCLLIFATVDAPSTAAHAALERSEPLASDVLAEPPAHIELHYTEPLERSYSRADLYDQSGNPVPDATSHAGDDDFAMEIDLPGDLPHGTYTVVWRTLSNADGHTAEGYVPFTVGSEADVAAVTLPQTTASGGPPEWLKAVSKWLALLGLAATVAIWPAWLFVLRPAISSAEGRGPALERRVRRLAVVAVALALVGNLAALLTQAAMIADGGLGGFIDAVGTTLGDTRYGTLWLTRIGLLAVWAAATVRCDWWAPKRRWPATAAALVATALLPLPFSLNSHASAQLSGRAVAVAGDVLHLLAASLWVGGLFVLVGALAPTLRGLTATETRGVLGRSISRFSLLALIAWGVMGLTGLYSAWLQVGNLNALRETAYGQSLMLKLGLLAPLLGLGAYQLLAVTHGLRRSDDSRASSAWSQRFVLGIGAEAVLVVLVLLVVGRLIGLQPARDELAQDAAQTVTNFTANGRNATLFLTPGTTGPNHYRLELGEGLEQQAANTTGTEALLRIDLPEQDMPQKEIKLARVVGNAFESHGSELSIAGAWTIQVIVREPGALDWTATTSQTMGATSPRAGEVPGQPWRFGTTGIVGLIALVIGIAGVVLAWQAGGTGTRTRRQSAGLGTGALALGAILLLQVRVDTGRGAGEAEAVDLDTAAIERGSVLFAANCVACHGPGGQGDGPAAASLDPPPADLTASHTEGHRDEDYAYWIANGIQGSAMPAFGEALTGDEIGDVVTFVRSLQEHGSDEAEHDESPEVGHDEDEEDAEED